MSMAPGSLRLIFSIFIAFSVASATGCASKDGALDLSGVPDATWGEAYSAQLFVVRVQSNGSLSRYNGPASYLVGDGSMAEGLTLNEAGLISGTPTTIGAFEQQVWVSNMQGIESFVDVVTFDVVAEGAFIGHERDQLTQISEMFGDVQTDIWLRPAEGGEQLMQVYTANVGLYLPGPNGEDEEGGGDDVRVGDLTPDEVTVTVGPWEEMNETDPYPGYPSGHYNDGSPPTHTGGFTFSAGSDTGEMDVSFSHEIYGIDSTRVMVVPPDWCPNGFQEGSDWDNGICE